MHYIPEVRTTPRFALTHPLSTLSLATIYLFISLYLSVHPQVSEVRNVEEDLDGDGDLDDKVMNTIRTKGSDSA